MRHIGEHITHINLVEEATQILPLRWGVVLKQREWHSPEHQAAVQRRDLVPADVGVVLGKAQRVDLDHVSTPAKLGRDVLREHLRVTSRHIDVDVALAQQAVEKPIETHLDVWIAHLVPRDGELGLVEQDIVRFSWVNNLSFDVPRKPAGPSQCGRGRGYLLSGMRPDLTVEIGRDFEPKSKTRFGPRSNALRNDERWKVSDTLLPFDPRELGAVL